MTIIDNIKGKTIEQVRILKGAELAKVVVAPIESRDNFNIEIESITAIDLGAELFVRAYDKSNRPLGFGDGTIETERIVLAMSENDAYLLVPDPLGEVTKLADEEGVEVTYKYRVDPKEALLRRLEHIIGNITTEGSKIIKGKRGNTCHAIDQTTTTSDQLLSDGKASWTLARDAATGSTSDMSGAGSQNWIHNSDITTFYVRRCQIGFDTSCIPDGNVISAATMTVYSAGTSGGDDDGGNIVLVNGTDAGTSSPLVAGDFDGFSQTAIGTIDWTSLYNIGANVAITITNFDAIDDAGTTLIGVLGSLDIDDTTPTGTNVLRVAQGSDYPFLSVTSAPGGNANFLAFM